MWVPNLELLHTSELCHALGVEMGSADLDLEAVPDINTILKRPLGLSQLEHPSPRSGLPTHITKYLSNYPSLFASPRSMIAVVFLA